MTLIVGMATIGKVHDVPREFNFEWRIDDFFAIPKEAGKGYSSPSFLLAGESWYLKIYPYGKSKKVSDCVAVYLFRELCDPPINLVWSVGLKTSEGKIEQERRFTFVFGKEDVGRGNPFLWKRSMLSEQMSKVVPSGVLTIVCSIESYSKSTTGKTFIYSRKF